jgi:GGDEF domain-containing protein
MQITKKTDPSERLPLKQIEILHSQYNALFEKETALIKAGNAAAASAISNGVLKAKFDKLLAVIKGMSAKARQSQDATMKRTSEIGQTALVTTALLCILGILIGVISSIIVTRHITASLRRLRVATSQIAEGNFAYDPNIETKDEIGSLARSFVSMGKRLGKLEEMYLDASPLTRLPGGIAIENVMKRRIASGQSIAFCVIDLDNFKSFNDHYGYAHGNVVLKETAKIIEGAARSKGSSDDFVGHIGGDDFVVVTKPAIMRDICSEIIQSFDERIPEFYNEEDRTAGFIMGKNRQGQVMKFPIMTISIAIVTNENRTLGNPLEASEIAAELKDYAKAIPTSMYVVDKRREA